MKTYEELESAVIGWASDRKIIQNGTSNSQLLKAFAEMGELADAFNKGDRAEVIDGLGDVIVCLINFAAIEKLSLVECLASAYNEIKDRKGTLMPNGVFVKDEGIQDDCDCSNKNLTSLDDCPQNVKGFFDCSYNQLESMEGCPQKIGGSLYCKDSNLKSLKGCPERIEWNFDCSNNQLTSLEGCPKYVGGYFDCRNNAVKFTEEEIRSVCDVRCIIYV